MDIPPAPGSPLVAPPVFEHPGALAGPPVPWSAVRRVLAVRPDNLGDVVLLSPALRALHHAAPQARLTLLTSPAGAAAAGLLPGVTDVLVASPTWQHAGPAGLPDPAAELALAGRIAAGSYDAALVFTSFSQSPWPAGVLCLLAGVPVRAGLSREFGGAVLTHWVPSPPDDLHQVDRALYLLERLGVPGAGPDLEVRLPPGAREAAHAVAGVRPGLPYAVVLPGASCPSRRYAAQRFGQVARGLSGAGLTVLVAGSAMERPLVEAVAAAGGRGVVPLAGDLDVAGLAALLADADVAVTNNSGGMHLADALGTPLVVTFAGTELEQQYAPRGTDAVLLRRETACSPCRAFVCPYGNACLDVDSGTVVAAALDVMGRRAA